SADYRFDWTASMPGYFNINFNRKGESWDINRNFYGGITLDDESRAAPVNFVNARIGLEYEGWNWNLFGRNLFDEDNPVNAGLTGLIVQYRPRTFGIGVSKSF